MQITSSEWILHPEGIFRGRITAIEPTNRFVKGIPELTFMIETAPINEDGPKRAIRHRIYCIGSDTSQFSRMSRAISGKEVNAETLIGGQAVVVVQHYVKDNGRKSHRISQLGQSIVLALIHLSVRS